MATTKLREFTDELLSEFIDESMVEVSKEFDAQQLKEGAIPKTQDEKDLYLEKEKEDLNRLRNWVEDRIELAQKGYVIVLDEGQKFGMPTEVLEKVKKSGEILFGDNVVNILGKETLKKHEGLKEKLGLTDEDMNQIYRFGVACYDQNRFQDAIAIFDFIILIDYLYFSPWLMSGICLYKLENYQAALDVLSQAIYLKNDDPLPHFYSIFSLLMLGENETAKNYLDWVLNEIDSSKEDVHLEIIQLIQEQITK